MLPLLEARAELAVELEAEPEEDREPEMPADELALLPRPAGP